MKLLKPIITLALATLVILSGARAASAVEGRAVEGRAVDTPLPTIVVHAPKANLTLEVARTEEQRENGLMNRTSVPPHTGMIFVFDQDAPVDFWMKNTLVALDMIFVAPDGTVRLVDANVAVVAPSLPDDDIPRESGSAKYVIELAAGEAAQDGIAPGVRLDLAGV